MAKVIHFPAASLADTDQMDEDEMVKGYLAGHRGEPRPEGKAAQHGWRNGMADSGRLPITDNQRQIAYEFVRSPSFGPLGTATAHVVEIV
jgi:hypothetical protein